MGIEDAALKCFKSYQSEINVVFISNQTSKHHVDLGVVQIREQHCFFFFFFLKNWQNVFQTVNTVNLH